MFELEAEGLSLLRSTEFTIPNVIATGEYLDYNYLILAFIETLPANKTQWDVLGRKLAMMHRISQKEFGLDRSNYIGSLTQKNNKEETWSEFYANNRVIALSEIAFNKGLISKKIIKYSEALCNKLNDLVPAEQPALLHGDLWQGNLLCGLDSEPALIDPAVYFGHREMDLAMIFLFGSIPSKAIEEYNLIYKLEKGWKERMDIHQLYPLLVHLVIFGSGYQSAFESIVKKYN